MLDRICLWAALALAAGLIAGFVGVLATRSIPWLRKKGRTQTFIAIAGGILWAWLCDSSNAPGFMNSGIWRFASLAVIESIALRVFKRFDEAPAPGSTDAQH